jgi:type IV pilus assembly protein PilC
MPTFVWKGTQAGAVKEGTLVAESKDQVKSMLSRQNIIVTGVKEKGKELALPKFGGGVSSKEVAIFTRQLSVMVDAGLPIVQCLEILGTQNENPTFRKALLQIRQDVEGGANMSDSMRKHPKIFDNLYCNLILAGETGGILDTVLRRLSQYIEKAVKLKGAVKSALIYPIAVISISMIVVWVILTFVIPTFASLFAGLGAELPFLTRIVVAASNILARWSPVIIFLIIAGLFALRRYYGTYRGRRVIDGLVLKLPVLGDLMRKIAVARFCRTLGTLITSGVPILEGLEITAKTAGNAVIEDSLMVVRKSVEEGRSIADPLSACKQFPEMVCQMVNVGEKTGALDTMLNKVADFYEDEVDEAVANLMALLEPVLIMFLGGLIGTIVVAMYLPMFDLMKKIG